MEDVFFGFYTWLDKHPTEAVLVSMNYEPGSGTRDDARLQEHLYNILNGDLAKRYWIQTRGTVSRPVIWPSFLIFISLRVLHSWGRWAKREESLR
jgi:hypothetical protein